MRVHFGERLEEIRSDVVRMGNDAQEMVRLAVEATINGDDSLAEQVIEADDRVDDLERSVFNRTLITVLQEAPVANDLRLLISTLAVVSEIEKVGDDAVKLARRATKLHGVFPSEMRRALTELGDQSRRLLAASIRLYTEYSSSLAQEIILGDHEVDMAYTNARKAVLGLIRSQPENSEHLVRTMESFHALEHVADRAVAIAVRMQMAYEAEQ
ncbi:phosphate signaling complex protein PhoU [bacterium]|nr:MAG: phosphate signaling complex protein PhoU [bacterium]